MIARSWGALSSLVSWSGFALGSRLHQRLPKVPSKQNGATFLWSYSIPALFLNYWHPSCHQKQVRGYTGIWFGLVWKFSHCVNRWKIQALLKSTVFNSFSGNWIGLINFARITAKKNLKHTAHTWIIIVQGLGNMNFISGTIYDQCRSNSSVLTKDVISCSHSA